MINCNLLNRGNVISIHRKLVQSALGTDTIDQPPDFKQLSLPRNRNFCVFRRAP